MVINFFYWGYWWLLMVIGTYSIVAINGYFIGGY